jgi:hypothetical protein
MTLLSEASFLVTPNGYKASKLYAALPVPVEIAVNGNFLTDTNWTKGAGWTIANGFATAIGNAFDLEQSFSFTNTATYTVKYTITDYAYGGIRVVLYSSGNTYGVGLTRTSNGVYTESITIQNTGGSASNTLKIQTTTTNESFKISNVSVKLDTDMTFTRATKGTRVDGNDLVSSVAFNVPRIDYTGGGCPSILLEPQRTNLLLRSEDFSNASWAKLYSSTVVLDATVANPTGILYTYKYTASNLSFGGVLRQSATITTATTYTLSFFVKKGNHSFVGIRFNTAANSDRYITYNFDTDTINQQGVTATAVASRELFANGWVRFILVYTSTNSSGNCDIAITNSSGSTPTALTGTEYMYVYGAQLEAGAYPTSYIATVASTVTRNADVISKTGISDLLNPSEGTFYAEISALANDLTTRMLSLNDGTGNNAVQIRFSNASNQIRLDIYGQSASYRSLVTLSDITENHKVLIKWGPSGIFGFIDGDKYTFFLASGTGSGIPTVLDRFNFNVWSGGLAFYGKCKGVQVYKTALSDPQCQALTTL